MKLFGFLLSCMLIAALPAIGLDKTREMENRRIEFIKSSLDTSGIEYEEHSLFAKQGGFGTSIHVVYPATDKNIQLQFVLAIPLSTTHDSENVERFDIETALHLAERLKNNAAPMSVRIAFLGDEISALPEDISSLRNIGLSNLISLYDTPENVIICYIDLPFAPDTLTIHHGSDGTIIPLNVLQPLTNAFASRSIPYSFYVKYNELYKLRLINTEAPLERIQSMNFPGLLIKGNEGASNLLFAELVGEAIAGYISNIEASSENVDTHYSFFNLFNKTIYINELSTVLSFLAIGIISLILFSIYSLTHRHVFVIQSRVFLRRSWILLLHFLIFTGSLFLSNLIYFFIRRVVHVPDFHVDYISILIAVFIALCFYNLCVPVFYRFWIPRKDRFYGNAAVTLVVIGTVIAVFMDITFVPIFLWSFVFMLLGTIITNPWLVLLCAVLVPFQISGAFINIINSNSPGLAVLITSNNIFVTLFISCIALPEILMANRIILLFRHGRSSKIVKTRTIQQLAIIGVTIVLLTGLGISATRQVPPSPSRKTITEFPDSPGNIVSADMTSTEYLDRRVLSLSVNALGNPAKFNILINNENPNIPLVIYNAPVPFVRFNDDNTLSFRLGERPENPFAMEIVLPAELQCTIWVEAVYTTWDNTIDPEKPENTEDYAAVYRLSLPVAHSAGT